METTSRSSYLEQLRRRAKELLRAFRADDPIARLRVSRVLPRFATPSRGRPMVLADALFVVARENGFASWPRLKAHLEEQGASSVRAADSHDDPRAWRTRLLHDVRVQIVDLARQGDVEGLTRLLSATPLRTLLSLRAALIAGEDFGTVVDALVEGAGHMSPRVRFNCAAAMDHLADERCIEPLRALVDDPVPRVRRMALHALSCDACKIAPLKAGDDFVGLALDRALTDSSINVRRHAVSELAARCEDTRARQALEMLAGREEDRTIQRQIRRAFRRREAS